jgi:Uma2 family endonuclease
MNVTTTPKNGIAGWNGTSSQRLLTIADMAALPAELPSGPVRYELDNGRLIILPLADADHGGVESKFAGELVYQGDKKGHGKALCGDVGVILWRDPDRLVGSDVVFVTKDALPIKLSHEGYLETIPKLIVEVKSKHDTMPEVEDKVAVYLRAGVWLVWVADSKTRTVTAYRPGKEPTIHTENAILTAEDIIPGLRLPVRDVFD